MESPFPGGGIGNGARRERAAYRGQILEEGDRSLEKVNDLLVLAVRGAVALDVEGGETRGVLAELVAPEVLVRLALGDPVPSAWRVAGVNMVLGPEVSRRGK